MKRLGLPMLTAALALLCAGILSTRSAAWRHDRGTANLSIPLDMQGVANLELGARDLNRVIIADQPALLRIQRWNWAEQRDSTASLLRTTRDGARLRLDLKAGYRLMGDAVVEIPPGVTSLSGPAMNVVAGTRVGALRITGVSLRWQGDAQSLDLRSDARLAQRTAECRDDAAVFFEAGKVERVRISIERGEVFLDDLSQVGGIEIHAGREVSLKVGRVEDLRRILLLPFDGEPTPPPEPGTRRCGPGDIRIVR